VFWNKIRTNLPSRQAEGRGSLDSALNDTLPTPIGSVRTQPPMADAAWQKACESYLQELSSRPQMLTCAACAGWGDFHLELAELLWDQRSTILPHEARRMIHVSNVSLGLLAVYSPEQRLVQLRSGLSTIKRSDALEMNPRIMPASAKLLEGAVAQDFQTFPFALLMWHYGQTSALALSHMPSLQDKQLFLRRFPALAPNVLHLRHLRLIHALSREPVRLEEVCAMLPPEDRPFICPDLTSLYFTGALRIKSAT
jgi:hypothetical protein